MHAYVLKPLIDQKYLLPPLVIHPTEMTNFYFKDSPPQTFVHPLMYCILLTVAIYLFYNYFNYLPGENIYEIPENELSFQQSLKLLTDSSQ